MSTGHLAFLGAARFQGYWDAASNKASGSGGVEAPSGQIISLFKTGSSTAGGYHPSSNLTASVGNYWQVTGSGAINVDGQTTWRSNDWVIYSGSAWTKLAFEDSIASIILGDMTSSSFHMGKDNDQHIIFASGSVHSGSNNFTYNYNTNTIALPSASFVGDIKMADDKKIIFGDNNESYIHYREAVDDFLTISGSARGIVLSGSTIQIDGTLEGASPLKIGGEIQFTSAGESAAFNFGPEQNAKIFYEDGETGILVISGSSHKGVVVSGSHLIVDNSMGIGLPCADVSHAITLPNNDDNTGGIKANSFISYSSRLYKQNIVPLEDPIGILKKLNGVSFEWKKTGRQDYGFIAEDVGKVLPGIVSWDKDKKQAQGIEYLKLISFLVEASKYNDQSNKDLNKELIDKLQDQNKKILNFNDNLIQQQNKNYSLLKQELEKISSSFNKKLLALLCSTAFFLLLLAL